MPEVTDPRILAQLGQPQAPQLPTQPQPFPGALPSVNARRVAGQNTQVHTGLAVQAGERAKESLALSKDANSREARKFANQEKDRELNGGVDTTQAQDLAGHHSIMLMNELGNIRRLSQKDPRALRPTIGEVALRGITENPDLREWSQSETRRRADKAYSMIVDSSLYLATGAAYNERQEMAHKLALSPGLNDTDGDLEDKKNRLLAVIESAKSRAGPANLKVLDALKKLENAANDLYAPGRLGASNAPTEDRALYSGGDTKSQAVPEALQVEYSNWLRQQKPGQLNPAEYLATLREMGKKYGLQFHPPAEQLSAFVNAFNAGEPYAERLPSLVVPAGMADKAREAVLGSGGLSAGVANAGNALALYTPEMLSDTTRKGLEVSREQNPGAALTGEVLGSMTPAIGIESLLTKGLQKTGMGAAKSRLLADVGTNAGLGAAAEGARAEEGDTGLSALEGSLKGVLASLGMRGLIKGGRGFAGDQGLANRELLGAGSYNVSEGRTPLPVDAATPAKFQALSDDELLSEVTEAQRGLDAWKAYQQQARVAASQGAPLPEKPNVPHPDVLKARMARVEEYLAQSPEVKTGTFPEADLTTMQRAGMGNQEEGLQSLPFIHGARERAQESWNLHNSNRVLARIGETLPKGTEAGQAANIEVNKRLNAAYDKLRPHIKGPIDNGFRDAYAALKAQATSPEAKELFAELDDAVSKFVKPDGTYDGQGYREFSTQVRRLQEIWGKNDTAKSTAFVDMSRVAEKLRKQGQALVARNNPALGRQLKKVEGAWAHQARIEMASTAAGAMSSRGVYTPDQLLSAIKRMDTSKNKTAIARGKGLDQDYATAARELMGGPPVKKPSLFGSLIGAGALSGANISGIGALPINLAAALLTAGHTPGVKRLMQGKIGEGMDAFGKKIGAPNQINEETLRQLLTQALRAKMQ